MDKATASGRPSALGSGVLTALSTAAVSLSAAAVGALLARKFGHGAATDGFFAAYGVFLVLTLAAAALRVVVLPALARAHDEGRLGSEVAADAAALAVLAVPAVALATAGADTAAGWLTSGEEARVTAAEALAWLVPAAVAQLYAGLAASALAAADDYGTAAAGYAAGAIVGVALIFLRIDENGIVALSWGLALNGAIALVVPAAALAARGLLRRGGTDAGLIPRLLEFARGVSVPLALQALYVVALGAAAALGVGAQTTLGYAYLGAAFLVAVTASSLSLVSAVPLARLGLDGDRAARHIVHASWLSLVVVAAASGVVALAGEPIARAALGAEYGGETGHELGLLVAYLAPWAVASIALSVAFPLLFVAKRTRALPLVAVAAVALHVPLTWIAREWLGLPGVAAALAVTTALLLALLLLLLSPETLTGVARGLAAPVALSAALAAAAFAVAAWALADVAAAAAGLVAYVAALAALRPHGLRAAWTYVRELR